MCPPYTIFFHKNHPLLFCGRIRSAAKAPHPPPIFGRNTESSVSRLPAFVNIDMTKKRAESIHPPPDSLCFVLFHYVQVFGNDPRLLVYDLGDLCDLALKKSVGLDNDAAIVVAYHRYALFKSL